MNRLPIRFLTKGAFYLLAVCGSAVSQELPRHAVRTAAPVSPSANVFIAGDSVESMLLAEWEVASELGPRIRIVWGKEAVDQAPPEASRYTQQSFVFPTGTIRVLEFKEDRGGMVHAITVETAIYMLKGAGTVGVRDETVHLEEGDVVSYPSGVLRGTGDATVIAWTVTGTDINEAATAALIRGVNAPVTHFAEWDEGGRRVSASAATLEELAQAPPHAIRLDVKRYSFKGNSVRVAHNKQGGPTSNRTSDLDALIYVTSGKLRFFQDGTEAVAVAGDAIREVAGDYHHWYRIEDSSFVATSSLPLKGRQAAVP